MDKSGVLAAVFSNLGLILRYFASGFVAVGLWVYLDMKLTLSQVLEYRWLSFLVLSPTAGVLVYSLHTGAIIRAIDWLGLKIRGQSSTPRKLRNKKPWGTIFFLDTQRILRRASDDMKLGKVQREVDKWAELLNFLYCSSYFTMLVPLLIGVFRPCALNPFWPRVLIVGVILLVLAFISSWRLTTREFWLVQDFRQDTSQQLGPNE